MELEVLQVIERLLLIPKGSIRSELKVKLHHVQVSVVLSTMWNVWSNLDDGRVENGL